MDLNVKKIINKPTSAAIAYGLNWREGETNVLVIHLGKKTFDVSLMTNENGIFDVIKTKSDTHLGGVDFTERVVKYFIKLYEEKTGNDASNDKSSVEKLRFAVERAKWILSFAERTVIEIDSFHERTSLKEILTRVLFEKLNDDLFGKTIEIVEEVLDDSELDTSDINDIILVGGSSNIPKIKQLMGQIFDEKDFYTGIRPDEVVAYGASVVAGNLKFLSLF